jgi:hypothetical protein
VSGPAPVDALLPALGRLDALLHAVGNGAVMTGTLAASGDGEPPSRLTELGEALGLELFDLDVILLALAPDLDHRYRPLFAAMQQDSLAWRPSVDTLLQLLCATEGERLGRRARLGPSGPLVSLELIRMAPLARANGLELTLAELDPRIVGHLLGEDGLDARLTLACSLLDGNSAAADESLVPLLERVGDRSVLVLQGGRAAGGVDAAAALAARVGRSLLVLDLDRVSERGLDLERTARIAVREAALAGVMLCMATNESIPAPMVDGLSSWLGGHCGPLLVSARDGRRLQDVTDLDVLVVPLTPPGPAGRRRLWEQAIGELPEGADVPGLASRFRLGGEEITSAVRCARAAARLRAITGGDGRLSSEDLFAAARGRCGSELQTLASKVESGFGWDNLVIPADSRAQLNELRQRVEQRDLVIDTWGFRRLLGTGLGISALFAGASGTGKTMAAGVLANALELDLYAIDLASIVSKYIGETSKNLDRIFRMAEDANAILFFDEADALFGKRSEVRDSHDRYANLEIAYLLQKMEAYDGVAILATNLRQNLDEAFARRLAFTIHFPFPAAEDRLAIWRGVWPDEVPLADDLDLCDLAGRFRLSGGNIRNAALAAAFLAATDGTEVSRAHVLRAVRREYQKLGRGLSEVDLSGVEPETEESVA